MSFKECTVVILPTNQKADLKLYEGNHLRLSKYSNSYDKPNKNQHLYILSNEDIKEGEWCIHLGFSRIEKWNNDSSHFDIQLRRKIIATTNSSLTIEGYKKRVDDKLNYTNIEVLTEITLPKPSDQFIAKFIEAYNEGKPITKVLVEYEEYPYNIPEPLIKVNPKDNTITIKKVKDSWNREEVQELIRKAWADIGDEEDGSKVEDWILSNL